LNATIIPGFALRVRQKSPQTVTVIETPLSSAIEIAYLSFESPDFNLIELIGCASITTPIISIVVFANRSLIISILVKLKPLLEMP